MKGMSAAFAKNKRRNKMGVGIALVIGVILGAAIVLGAQYLRKGGKIGG
jgi:hypothetical protein